MPVDWLQTWALPIGAGVCLAAACGFRTFVPLLCIALAAKTGLFALDGQYAWLASTTGLIALSTASAAEVAGYYIPVVDHALDVIATPLATIAGVLVMFTSIGSDHGLLGWLIALVLGGGVSGALQLATVKTRALAFGATAGLANPLVATVELLGALGLSAVALLIPVVALVAAVAVGLIVWRLYARARRRRPVPAR